VKRGKDNKQEKQNTKQLRAEETKDVYNFKNIAEGSFEEEKDMTKEVIEVTELKVEAHDECATGETKKA